MEEWKFNRTFSGVPQGSILSPVLSNILLSKLDRFVETKLLPQYNKGSRRKANQTYRSLINRAHRLRQQGQKEAAQKIKQQAQKLPAIDPKDPEADNLRMLQKLKWVMEQSLTKTLAAKQKISVCKVYQKYHADLESDGKS